MSKKYTPTQKKVIFIFALMLYLPMVISYFDVKYNWDDDSLRVIVTVVGFVIAGFLVYFMEIAKKEERVSEFPNDLKDMMNNYFQKIDIRKKSYPGSWSVVEEWKQKMSVKADKVMALFKIEGETDAVLEMWEELEYDLDTGLRVIREGNNPLIIKKKK